MKKTWCKYWAGHFNAYIVIQFHIFFVNNTISSIYFTYLSLKGNLYSVGDRILVSSVVSCIYIEPKANIPIVLCREMWEDNCCLCCVLLHCALLFLWSIYYFIKDFDCFTWCRYGCRLVWWIWQLHRPRVRVRWRRRRRIWRPRAWVSGIWCKLSLTGTYSCI